MDNPSLSQCRGENMSGQEWFNIWSNDACYNTLYEIVYGSIGGRIAFNPTGYAQAQSAMNDVFQNYLGTNSITTPGANGYNPFQETIRSTCTRIPGICDPVLSTYCHNCPQCGSREDIASNIAALEFCGCYAPRSELSSPKLTPECDPLCVRIDTIPLPDNKGNALECLNNVCVIDDVSIQAVRSSIGSGSIDFRQVCSLCKGGPCTCIISGVDISDTLTSIGIEANFDQLCGADSTCLEIQPDGVDKVVDCKTSSNQQQGTNIHIWMILAGGILVIGILLVFLLVRNRSSKIKRNNNK